MDWFHHKVLKIALWYTGDKYLKLFTLHRAAFEFLGYDFWATQEKNGQETNMGHFVKKILHPIFYSGTTLIVSILTGHKCLYLNHSNSLEHLQFMNNIILIFAFMSAFFKTLYMKFSYGKHANNIIHMLEGLDDLKNGRKHWEESLKAFSYYMLLLCWIVGSWSAYFFLKYHNLSFLSSYPWNQKTLVGMLAAFEIAVIVSIYTCMIHTTIDSFVSISCGILTGHLQVLIDSLKDIGKLGTLNDAKILHSAVNLHGKVLIAAEKLNYCFNVLFSIQQVYTILHGCVIIFNFVKVEDKLAAFINTMPMLMASYGQLLLYCYYSNKLTSKYDEVTFACYNNQWYLTSLDVKKGLLMLSKASKKEVALRGIGTQTASFKCLQSTIQDSYSAYLILNTVATEDH